MKALHTLILLAATTGFGYADSKFEQDRAAILGMAGKFEVTFSFKETVSLAEGYELKKPYKETARELVDVASDTGEEITLQHILVVEDMDGPRIIKHWAQIWKYQDPVILNYEGHMTWMPQTLTEEEVKGTWTQLVTQIDDSPRYKAAGTWTHNGNYSAWTSSPSTRPLPRRDYTKRSDYDLLKVVNQHIITPNGWVHMQDNRKFVRRNGQNKSLCLESGLNTYKRMTDLDELAQEDFAAAEKYWTTTQEFWAEVRLLWNDIIVTSNSPIHYVSRKKEVSEKPLMYRISDLATKFTEDPASATSKEIATVIGEHLN